MHKKQVVSGLMLALTALIWGSAFVAQSVGMEHVGPFTFNCVRSALAALALLPVIRVLDAAAAKQGGPARGPETPAQRKLQWKAGIACGVMLCLGSTLQQMGIQYTTVGKAGFITAMYIVIVPVLGAVFLHQKPGLQVWAGVVIAVAGLYLLCMKGGFSVGLGDILLMCGSVMFSIHILVIDKYSPLVDGVRLASIQFLVVGVLCLLPALLIEKPSLSAILGAWGPILYAGILSSGVAYTLQIVGQKNVQPTIASLILSLESVFSVLAGWVVLHQALSAREALGCALMFAAILLAQLPSKAQRKAEKARQNAC